MRSLEDLTCRNVLFNDALNCQDYTASVIDKWRDMDHWCNGTDRRKSKNSVKILSQCHFIHQRSNINWPGIRPGTPTWEAGYYRPQLWHTRVTFRTYRTIVPGSPFTM